MEAERVNVSSVVSCFRFFVIGRRPRLMCRELVGSRALRYVEARDGKLLLPTCHHLIISYSLDLYSCSSSREDVSCTFVRLP